VRRLLAFAVFALAALAFPATGFASASGGVVYTLSNGSGGNRVIVFDRGAGGNLHAVHSFATGGRGTGANLGSQGALALSPDGSRLYAVNAASDSLSMFRASGTGLTRTQVIGSGGDTPISVVARAGRVYVLNAGSTPSVVGFRLTGSGLVRIHGSWRALDSVDAGAAQVGINPAGNVLVVTNKASSTIDTFRVHGNGSLSKAISHPSVGGTPFGFAFTRSGVLVVSDASIPPTSGATSYTVTAGGGLVPRSDAVQNHQQAACWVATTPDSRFAYTANAGSGTLSGYRVRPNGSIALLDANGATANTGTGSHPLDESITPDGRFLYVLADGFGQVEAWRIAADGSLHHLGNAGSLPAGTVGLEAR
jgi:6-phosphogluconolactonase (cycloisomerase 2 family)